MTVTATTPSTRTIGPGRRTAYGRHVSGAMLAAFTLSVGHTVYAWVAGIEDPGFTVYPTTFGPAQQTVFGWFENDVYLGLLTVALYLSVLRLGRVILVPRP